MFDFKTGWEYACLERKEEEPRGTKDVGEGGHKCEKNRLFLGAWS